MSDGFSQLVEKYLANSLSPAEEQRLIELSREVENMRELEAVILQDLEQGRYEQEALSSTAAIIYNKIAEKMQPAAIRKMRWWKGAAAAILLLVTTYWWLKQQNTSIAPPIVEVSNEILPPVSSKATLTLADGKQIVLDSAGNGTLAMQGNSIVQKRSDGELVYDASGKTTAAVVYNTLNNPRGSKVVSLALEDGSKVWLNAESSIRFPTAFIGSERRVEITGEAYFEVAHRTQQPFVVAKENMEVTVLGTHFNINAYDDEPGIRVTLLEGSVRVHSGKINPVILQPGQQGRVNEASIQVVQADMNEVMSWKENRFYFMSMDIKSIMRQVSRWYDVEVVHEENINDQFTGIISRQVKAVEVFRMLQQTGIIQLKVEGKKIIVQKATL